MKKTLMVLGLMTFSTMMYAQSKFFTKTGQAWFDAGTGVENITGTNKAVTSVIAVASGKIQFSMMIKGFEFWSQLLQDHFNENYMESEKFPKSTFSGTITNMDKVNISKDGTYPVNVKGTLEIHGVKKEVDVKGTIKVEGKTISASSEFVVFLDDYKIAIPSVVKDKLSKTAKVKITCNYTELK